MRAMMSKLLHAVLCLLKVDIEHMAIVVSIRPSCWTDASRVTLGLGLTFRDRARRLHPEIRFLSV